MTKRERIEQVYRLWQRLTRKQKTWVIVGAVLAVGGIGSIFTPPEKPTASVQAVSTPTSTPSVPATPSPTPTATPEPTPFPTAAPVASIPPTFYLTVLLADGSSVYIGAHSQASRDAIQALSDSGGMTVRTMQGLPPNAQPACSALSKVDGSALEVWYFSASSDSKRQAENVCAAWSAQ